MSLQFGLNSWGPAPAEPAIPDSVVIQNYATTWSAGETTWVDDATDDGSQDTTITGSPTETALSDGSDTIGFAQSDYGTVTLPPSLEGSNLQSWGVEVACQYTSNGGDLLGLQDDAAAQSFRILTGQDADLNTESGNFLVVFKDENENEYRFGPSTNPNLDDGSRHNITISIDDATVPSATIVIDGSSVSLLESLTEAHTSWGAWQNDAAIAAFNSDAGPISEKAVDHGAIRWHTSSTAQTISDYP
jgi:hypothetical protein